MSAISRRVAALAAPFALAACITATPPADPLVAETAGLLRDQAAQLHRLLAIESTPECSYEQNKNYYEELRATAQSLEHHIAAGQSGPALPHAGKALTRLVDDASASHQAASAVTDDLHGPCLAPGAIALNAQAFDRATAAILATLPPAGDQ